MDYQKKSREIIAEMNLEEKIGQCVVVGMSGTQITNDLKEAVTRYHCSGLRLSPFLKVFRYFSDDKAKKAEINDPEYSPSKQKMMKQGIPPSYTAEQYAATLNELRDLAAERRLKLPLHMVIDQEGDTSKDIARGGIRQFPSSMGIVASDSTRLAYDVAKSTGIQMKAGGFDMIHSPVVDVNINPNNPEIGRRAYSDDPDVVAEYALAQIKGYKDAGVIAAAKHFPGRGDSATDAHHACPSLDVSKKRLLDVELRPYKKLIAAEIDSIMIAHCMYPQIDPDNISSVSRKIVTGLLRDELGFKGLITTDSMTMGALIDKYGTGEACARALQAGADIILMKAENEWRGEMFYTIRKWVEEGRIKEDELDQKLERILSLKFKYGLFSKMGKVKPEKVRKPFNDSYVVQTEKKAAVNAVMVCKDQLQALPLSANKKTLLINQQNTTKTPNDYWDHPSLFQEIMEKELPDISVIETEFGYAEEDEKFIFSHLNNKQYDLIICTNFYDRASQPQQYVKKLIDQDYPVLIITNTPYCIKECGGLLTDAKSIILNMNLNPQGLKTCAEVLLGKTKPQGRWPISNYDPLSLR